MSLSEESSRERDELLRLVDAGVSVPSAAVALGLSSSRAYTLLRACGRGSGRPKTVVTAEHRRQVRTVFAVAGSVNQAAIAAGLSHSAARRILVEAGAIVAETTPRGGDKAAAKQRFLELIGQGWSSARAARDVGVNERTGREWRKGVRRSGNKRIYPDGTVVDSGSGTRYKTSMIDPAGPVVSSRHLSLEDRLAIADRLINKQTITQIAAAIGKHKSTVSREVARHSVEGVYLPYQAHRAAATARARPKTSKLADHRALREQVEHGLERKLSPEQISRRLVKDFPDDESMRVSHETIYQALYFQARGGLKREVHSALRTGRARRKPHRHPDQRQHRFVEEMVMIADRPAEVADRAVPGHWEGDLERHEALCYRAEVEGLRRWAVAAA